MPEKKDAAPVNSPDVRLSSLTENSTYSKNSDPNPLKLDPAPGPSTIQEPGRPSS